MQLIARGDSSGARINLQNEDGDKSAVLYGNWHESGGLDLYDENQHRSIEMMAHDHRDAPGGGSVIYMKNASNHTTIKIDADRNGVGRITTDVLEITGGSDFSEYFDVEHPAQGSVEPGMLVCIDPLNPGKLRVSTSAYDPTLAGIVSGAGNVRPGMVMGQAGTLADGSVPVALSGRVYCRADASKSPIQPGNLLTTSDTPGHAMRVTDHARSQGAIIGKAMTPLEEGRGLVLVLVSHQ